MTLQIGTIHPAQLTADDRRRWIAAIESGDRYSPLFHPDFTALVAEVRQDVRIIRARDMDGRLGFLPLHRRRFGLSRPIAAAFSDYHGPVCEPGFALCAEDLLSGAGIGRYKYFARIGAGERQAGQGLRADLVAGAPDPAAHFQDAHAKKAKQLRRLRRKLERERGAVSLALDDGRAETFDRLRQWKQAQFRATGRHDVLRPAWAANLLGRLREGGLGEVRGYTVSLNVDGVPVAAEFGPRWKGVFHPWIAAYDPEFSDYSPGHLLVVDLLERMRIGGLDRYDLGQDDADYKAMFANTSVRLTAGVWSADGRSRAARHWPGLLGRFARRWEQICLTETSAAGLMAGAASAAIAMIRR